MLVRASKPTSSQTNIPFRPFLDEKSVLFLREIFLDIFGLDSPFICFHEIVLAVIASFCGVQGTSSFSSYSAGARDDDFECVHESGSSKRSLGSILKRLHVCLMMSAKIFIFGCRGVCAFTQAKREEKSAFLFKFLVVRGRGSVGSNILSWVHHRFLPKKIKKREKKVPTRAHVLYRTKRRRKRRKRRTRAEPTRKKKDHPSVHREKRARARSARETRRSAFSRSSRLESGF
jgi:hypothetical protein